MKKQVREEQEGLSSEAIEHFILPQRTRIEDGEILSRAGKNFQSLHHGNMASY